ncbi:Rxlr effector protein, partial [Globisporangium splendens]
MGDHRATQALLGSPSSGAAYEMDESTAEIKEGEQVQAISRELELMQSEEPIEWSHLEQRIIKAILRVSRAEKRQVRRYRQKLEDQQHRPANRSRRQLIEEQANAAREAAEFKFGLRGRDGRRFGAGIQQHPTRGTHAKIIRSRNRYSVAQERRFTKSPLDYRPITLLTTTYKLFAKVLATRLQDILLWIIGEEQQGFVRDRLMENAILIMQAALDKAYHSSTEGFDDAPGIVMLDFMEAYDTLDRDFLYLVLSKFGFGRQFVDLVRRMHTDTTAQYLVNGELSKEWEVKSGIRQGCPLAPLLFIVAAEILALAVQQDPYLEGIRVTKSGAEPHLISTFVDDSAVFLKQGNSCLG